MNSQPLQDRSFEAKLGSLKDELLASGLTLDTFLNLEKLIEILNTRIYGKQFARDLLVSISDSIAKNVGQSFRLSQFFDACATFRKSAQIKTENAQMHLAKLQKEKIEALEAIKQIKTADQANLIGSNRHGMLILEVNGLQGLKVTPAKLIYIKLSCYNGNYKTSALPYSEEAFWHDKFTFEVVTGFERVDIQVLSSELSGQIGDEYIGGTQVHVSSLKNHGYHKEWAGLYNGKSYTPVGNILLGIQMTASKSEYLEKILEKLEQHIKFQIEEIEESEKNLKNLNILIAHPSSQTEKVNGALKSPRTKHQRSHSETPKGALKKSKERFRTIEEEDDGNSTETEADDVKMPDFSGFSRVTTNYDNDSPEKNDLMRTYFNEQDVNYMNKVLDKRPRVSQGHTLTSKEAELKGRNPFQNGYRHEILMPFTNTRSSSGPNSLVDTNSQSQSQSLVADQPKNSSIAGQEADNKDAVINYLQKKLNESTFENERLNKMVAELTKEKQQREKTEMVPLKEYKTKMQEYETKIFGLVSEIERLGKTAHKKASATDIPTMSNNGELEKLVKQLQEENIKLTQSLAKKSQEIANLRTQTKENREKNRENLQPNLKVAEQNLNKTMQPQSNGFMHKIFQFEDMAKYEKTSLKNVPNGNSTAGKKTSIFPTAAIH